jgi:hypothetical protein
VEGFEARALRRDGSPQARRFGAERRGLGGQGGAVRAGAGVGVGVVRIGAGQETLRLGRRIGLPRRRRGAGLVARREGRLAGRQGQGEQPEARAAPIRATTRAGRSHDPCRSRSRSIRRPSASVPPAPAAEGPCARCGRAGAGPGSG